MARNDIPEKELKPCHYRAVTALVASGDVTVAAQAAGVSERTLRQWMIQWAFKSELDNAETEVVRSAARRLGRLADKALAVLENVLDDTSTAGNPRIRAATTILETCLRWREQVSLEDRVATLERRGN
jgi:transposase-like protein